MRPSVICSAGLFIFLFSSFVLLTAIDFELKKNIYMSKGLFNNFAIWLNII